MADNKTLLTGTARPVSNDVQLTTAGLYQAMRLLGEETRTEPVSDAHPLQLPYDRMDVVRQTDRSVLVTLWYQNEELALLGPFDVGVGDTLTLNHVTAILPIMVSTST